VSTWKTTSRVYDPKRKEFVTVKVELDIQWQKIADTLARKAINNKSRRSALVAGSIKATVKVDQNQGE
jgi:hypothetical protein